jgi:hypothetical protein
LGHVREGEMRAARWIIPMATIALLGGCASVPGGTRAPSEPGDVAPSAVEALPTVAPTPATTPSDTPTSSAAAQPTAAGPLVLESTTYPYRITLPGPDGLLASAPVPWDGTQVLIRGGRHLDVGRADAGSGFFLVMSPTPEDDLQGFLDELVEKYASWHACTPPTAVREFSAGEMPGVTYQQACAGGREQFARAIVVGEGHGILVFTEAGASGGVKQDELIAFLQGLEWTEPR